MTGKEKCKILKDLRNRIALANGIIFVSSECDFEGECFGFCPKCDSEVRFLENALMEKAKMGLEINLESLADASVFDSDYYNFPDDDGELLGDIIPMDDFEW